MIVSNDASAAGSGEARAACSAHHRWPQLLMCQVPPSPLLLCHRCYPIWMDFSKCMAEADEPKQCKDFRDDYLECLHHRKEARPG